MTRTIVERRIAAPVELVFKTISESANFSKAVPHIVRVEMLTKKLSGVGTRFRETRLMHGKEAMTELEVTEYVPNQRVRMVADSHGTIWDTVFTVQAVDGQTELELVMDAKAYQLLPKILKPLMRRFIAGTVEVDMDAVKVYCEKEA